MILYWDSDQCFWSEILSDHQTLVILLVGKMSYKNVPICQSCSPDVQTLKDHAHGDVINPVTLATDGSLIKTAL